MSKYKERAIELFNENKDLYHFEEGSPEYLVDFEDFVETMCHLAEEVEDERNKFYTSLIENLNNQINELLSCAKVKDKNFSASKFKIRKIKYSNAVSYKFDNRRITVCESGDDGGIGIDIRKADTDPTSPVIYQHIHGKVSRIYFNLSREAAEILMFSLHEQLGFSED